MHSCICEGIPTISIVIATFLYCYIFEPSAKGADSFFFCEQGADLLSILQLYMKYQRVAYVKVPQGSETTDRNKRQQYHSLIIINDFFFFSFF